MANFDDTDSETSSGKPWFVYICKSAAGHYYVGMSTDPQTRLTKHNQASGSKMALDQGGFVLCYVSKPFSTKAQARTREIQLKKWSRMKKEKLITGEWE